MGEKIIEDTFSCTISKTIQERQYEPYSMSVSSTKKKTGGEFSEKEKEEIVDDLDIFLQDMMERHLNG